jgi:hypothetical protein
MDLKEKDVSYGLDVSGWGGGLVMGLCEYDNELPGFLRDREFCDELSDF